jgi:hypothetical protein
MTDRTEELRETAAQCVALAQSTSDPAVRAALIIMAQKLCDVANHRSAAYEVAQREFNDRQIVSRAAAAIDNAATAANPVEERKIETSSRRDQLAPASAGFSFSPANLSQVPGVSTVRNFPMRGAEPC